MDKFEKQIQEMLRTSGASLVRRKRHQVWRLPNGRHFVHPSSGSDHLGVRNAAAERAAAMYSLIGSAKLNGLDPELYLHTVLARIADYPVSHIDDLLPWNLAPALQSHTPQLPAPIRKEVPTVEDLRAVVDKLRPEMESLRKEVPDEE
jgi:IS66 C-terminal element